MDRDKKPHDKGFKLRKGVALHSPLDLSLLSAKKTHIVTWYHFLDYMPIYYTLKAFPRKKRLNCRILLMEIESR